MSDIIYINGGLNMKTKISIIVLLMAFIIAVSSLFGYSKKTAFAEEYNEVKSSCAYLIDADTKSVIYSKNENDKKPIASMCKIMTLLLTFEAIERGELKTEEKICVSENASHMGGSQVFLEANADYLVNDLIKSIVIASANDACVAMAERLCGSESVFVDKMNERAKELGMDNTVFVNCTGLPKPSQHSTAKDVSTMFAELIKHKEYFNYSKIWMDKIPHPHDRYTEISNTNKLVRFYKGCDGGKTGYTNEAGHCLAASAERNGTRLVGVVISAPDSKSRFNDVSSMFNYGFANFESRTIIDANKPLEIFANIKGGKQEKVQIIAENNVKLFGKKTEIRGVEFSFVSSKNLTAPIKKGDKLGEIIVFENNIEIAKVNALATCDVDEKTYFDYIKDIVFNWALI